MPLPSDYIPADTLLRELRRAGMPDGTIARLVGVNQSTITRLRNGTTTQVKADLYFAIYDLFRQVFPRGTRRGELTIEELEVHDD